MLGAHESFYYLLYGDHYFYTVIRNGLIALLSRNVDNFLDAHSELYNFCTRSHHTITASLCNPCTVTKDLIREVMEEEHPDSFFSIALTRIFTMVLNVNNFLDAHRELHNLVHAFCRFGVTDPFTMRWRLDREGYWGEVMNANGVMIRVYLGTTSEQIIDRIHTVLFLCFYDV